MKGALGKMILNKTITLVLKSKEAFTNLELIAESCNNFFDKLDQNVLRKLMHLKFLNFYKFFHIL